MPSRNLQIAFFLYLGTVVILLAATMYSAPVSSAYLTWDATVGPNSLGMKGSVTEKEPVTPVPLQPTRATQLPTDAAVPEETPLPSPTLAPATEVEISIEGYGVFDYSESSFGVTGLVCVRNSGANPTDGISPLQLQVYEIDEDQNSALVPGADRALAINASLAAGEERCFVYKILFPAAGAKKYQIAGSVTITNYQGWQPLTENCPTQTACPYGPVEKAVFTLPDGPTPPVVTPTQVPPEPPTQAPTEKPTLTPTETATQAPTETATQAPTQAPTDPPTQAPTEAPTGAPTETPTQTTG